MKIAVVSNLYPPLTRGGAERVASRIVAELLRRGHTVTVITTMPLDNREALTPQVRAITGETVYRYFPPNIYHLTRDYKFPYVVRAMWHLIDLIRPPSRVRRILIQERPDIVLTHNLKGIGMRAPQAAYGLGIPVVHTIHDVQLSIPSGLLLYETPPSPLERALRSTYERMTRWALGRPSVVISPSQFLTDFYRARGFFAGMDVRVMPNPAPAFQAPTRVTRPEGPLRILFAGQLEKHKGLMQLLDAFDLANGSIELHIAGEGTLSDYIRGRSERDERINYHGLVSSDTLQNLFAFMDATVVPSLCYENSPTIIYESLQCGVPVISSKIGGVGELIQEGKNGRLVEPGNVQALADAMRHFVAEAPSYWSRAAEIRSSVAPYSMTHYVDKLETIMTQIEKKSRT